MTFEADLRAHLLGDAQIAAAIADEAANESRFYPLERPQGQKNLRALVYTPVNQEPASSLDEADDTDAAGVGCENVYLQLDVYGQSFEAARELARLVRNRMALISSDKSIRAVCRGQRSGKDPETRENREILEFSVWHSPQ